MAEYSMLWETGTTGDGAAAGYTEAQTTGLFHHTLVNDLTDEGVLKGYLNALDATPDNDPAAPVVEIDTGGAWVYGFHYWQDAAQDLAITLPAVGDTGFRIVLRASYAPTRTVRLAVLMNTDGVAAIPAVTQTVNTTWEISLYTGVVDTSGDIWTDATKTVAGVTDTRVYCHANIEVETANLADLAVTTGKIADSAVTALKIANRTRRFFVQAVGGINVSTSADLPFYIAGATVLGFGIVLPDAVQSVGIGSFAVPADFVSGLTVKAVVASDSSGNCYATQECDYGADGEDVALHTASGGGAPIAIVGGKRNVIASTSLAAAAAGDYVNLRLGRLGGDANDTVNDDVLLSGWEVTYTADS